MAVLGGFSTREHWSCLIVSNKMPGMINRPPSMSGGSGGGIMSVRGRGLPLPTTLLVNTQIYNNSAGMGGGLVAIDSGFKLINSYVYNNTANGDPSHVGHLTKYAGGQGGGILHDCAMSCRRPNSTLINSSVFNNTANYGGGISIRAGSINLSHSFVHNNKALFADSGVRTQILSNVKDHSMQDVLFLVNGSGIYDN